MIKPERLYQHFVELIFALIKEVRKVDQAAVDNTFEKIKAHRWGSKLDFRKSYGRNSDKDLEYRFRVLVAACENKGPDREYEYLIQLLKEIADAVTAGKKKKEKAQLVLKQFRLAVLMLNAQESDPPGMLNFIMEGRSVFEWGSMFLLQNFLPNRIDGQENPVLLLPPLFGTDFSTRFLRSYLKKQNFYAYKWKLGVNLIRSYYLPPLENRLMKIYEKHQKPISIVGWSGGGMLGKIIANRHPDKVAQLVTIGSPVWGLDGLQTYIKGLYEFLRGRPLSERNEKFNNEVDAVPKVPITCIYTKTDGVVPWRNCLESESLRDDIQNIEVYGSHSGMGANPAVLLIVAYALSQRLNGKKVKKLPPNIEKMLFPLFWQEKRVQFSKK